MQVFTPAKHSAETDNNTLQVLRDDIKEKKVGSFFVPGQAIEVANEGRVVAAVEDSQYKRGDRIVFVKYAGAVIELDGVEYILLKEKEVQGTLTVIDSPTDIKPQTKADVDAVVQEALAKLSAQGNS